MLFYFYRRLQCVLRFGVCNSGGRNMVGRICIRGRGRGNRRLLFNIDIFRRICEFGIITKFLYDFRRSAIVGCLLYVNGLVSYIILTKRSLQLNRFLFSGFLGPDVFLEDG